MLEGRRQESKALFFLINQEGLIKRRKETLSDFSSVIQCHPLATANTLHQPGNVMKLPLQMGTAIIGQG